MSELLVVPTTAGTTGYCPHLGVCLRPSDDFLPSLLDPSTQPPAIALAQQLGSMVVDQLCHMTHTWLFLIHKESHVKLGLWIK